MSACNNYPYADDTGSHTQQYLLPVIRRLLRPDKNKCILDAGCGNGALAIRLLREGYNVYGTDASAQGISHAARRYPERFFVQNLEDEALPAALQHLPFDTILSTEVIEHLYKPRQFMLFCKQALSRSPGQKELIISTPYHGYWKNVALALSGQMDRHFTALWDGGHIKFWSRRTLTALLNEFQFEVTAFHGAGRVPLLWKSMVVKSEMR